MSEESTPFRVLDRPLPAARNYFTQDPMLARTLERLVPAATWAWARPQLARLGEDTAVRVDPLAVIADREVPKLRSHDRFGERVDDVVYHPAYREMERIAYGSGMIALKYEPEARAAHGPAVQPIGFAMAYTFTQGECGLVCPACMTDGVARLVELYGNDDQKRRYVPRLAARDTARLWRGAMFLTEKQGGSDVGVTGTRAVRDGDEGRWRLHGEKWFCSNVDAEVILALARPEGAPDGTKGLGLFLVPRDLPDGRRNGLRIDRLKDKLGTRSMPTGEVTLDGARAELLGDLGRGFKQMAEMLNLSRLYNAICSVALMRRAVHEATEYLRARRTFGRAAIEHALVRENLADLNAEEISAKMAVFQVTHHLGLGDAGSRPDALLVRILTPLLKYSTAKRAVWAASEGIELLGGNGYIEESVMPRLLRDAQVLPVWEGTTNILVLDTLRACAKTGAHEALFEEVQRRCAGVGGAAGQTGLVGLRDRTRALADWARDEMGRLAAGDPERTLPRARRWTDRLLLSYELSLLLEEAASGSAVADIAGAAAWRLLRRHVDPELETSREDLTRLVDQTVTGAAAS